MKTLKLALQQFAQPCPLKGHLSFSKGNPLGLQRGIEIHRQVQYLRKKQYPGYQSEVRVSHRFHGTGFDLVIEGRMDGLLPGSPDWIEEIKSDYDLSELHRALQEDPYSHPYGLQLLTYGYVRWRETAQLPKLTYHLVSTRGERTLDLEISLDIARFEAWLAARLEELTREFENSRKRACRRRKLVKSFTFPYELRKGQDELVEFVRTEANLGRHLLLQAPTGMGKTMGVLFPLLQEALARGEGLLWVTPKNSQQQVAASGVKDLQTAGSRVKVLELTAKSKLCLKNEVLCEPQHCEFARNYFDKLRAHRLPEALAKKRSLSGRTFRKLGHKFEVCPYGLQQESLGFADVVIGDYNHVFSRQVSLHRKATFIEERPNLAVDEAHNLPERAKGYFSPALEFRQLGSYERVSIARFADLLSRCLGLCRRAPHELSPYEEFNQELQAFLRRYLDGGRRVAGQDPVLGFYNYWTAFFELLPLALDERRPEFCFLASKQGLKIVCCDPSELVRERYESFHAVVAFSATLKPFEFYAKLTGLESQRLRTAEFQSPFCASKRKILIIPQVSTKFSERERNYGRIAEVVQRVVVLRPGNYLVFLPSFDFLERVLAAFNPPAGFEIQRQRRSMPKAEIDSVLENLRDPRSANILFAVQGGIFSEGVDYLGEMAIGAFVVGPPLPNFGAETQAQEAYYEQRYLAGFEFTYANPAMARAIQSAGRVIRSMDDRGIILLLDDRFLRPEFAKSMPTDWFRQAPAELVSEKILFDLQEFWGVRENEKPTGV